MYLSKWPNRLTNPRGFAEIALLLCLLYVLLQLISRVSRGWVFFALLLVGVIIASIATRFDIVILAIPLILLQQTHPFGPGNYPLQNWIGKDIFGISMVHYLIAIICIHLLCQVYHSRYVHCDRYTLGFLISISVSAFISHISSLQFYLYELVILGVIPLFSLYVQNVLGDDQRELLAALILVIPVAITWGNVLLRGASIISGVRLHPRLTTIVLLIVGVLFGVALSTTELDLRIRSVYLSSIVVFLIQFIQRAQRVGSGSITLIGILIVVSLSIWKLYQYRNHSTKILLSTVLLISIILIAFVIVPGVLPRYIIFKIFSLVASLLQLDLSGMAHSPAVRVIEIVNIVAYEVIHGPSHVVFGMGIGGYFTDFYLPFERFVELGHADYSIFQRQTGHFFSPHNTPGYVLLKQGLVGLVLVAAVIIRMFRVHQSESGMTAVFAVAAFLSFGAVVGFGVKNGIILGLLLGFVSTAKLSQFTIHVPLR